MLTKISAMLDAVADRLEARGLTKEAHEIDKVSDSIEKIAKVPLPTKKPATRDEYLDYTDIIISNILEDAPVRFTVDDIHRRYGHYSVTDPNTNIPKGTYEALRNSNNLYIRDRISAIIYRLEKKGLLTKARENVSDPWIFEKGANFNTTGLLDELKKYR